jgi:2-keto-4-pentenoate hydratase/2-oxohepta-3-ene-1,7-dioic acid hydratase in catechol pathway
MKLYTFILDHQERVGAECDEGRIIDLTAASGGDPLFSTMISLIEGGGVSLEKAQEILASYNGQHSYLTRDVILAAPIPRPRSIRGFSVFEKHLRQSAEGAARRMSQASPDPEAAYHQIKVQMNLDKIPSPGWRAMPCYYLMDHTCVAGHNTIVEWPSYSNWIDYELELVAVIGKPGKDIEPSDVSDHIFGYTVVNDLSARDAQIKAMATGLGPGKGKDFYNSNPMGPCIVTADEVPDPYALQARVFVNGEQWSSSDGTEAIFRFDQCISYASQSQMLVPGDTLTTGTLPNSSSIELQKEVKRGDTITFDVDVIGKLQVQIG